MSLLIIIVFVLASLFGVVWIAFVAWSNDINARLEKLEAGSKHTSPLCK